MLTLKSYGWEGAATARVDELRRAEAEGLFEAHSMRGLNNGLYFAAPAASALAVFATYRAVYGGDGLTVEMAYTTLALLNVRTPPPVPSTPAPPTPAHPPATLRARQVLRLSIGKHLMRASESLPEALVAVRRMQARALTPTRHSHSVRLS